MSSRMAIEDTHICSVDVDLIPTACHSIRAWICSQFLRCASIKVNRTASAIATTGEEQFSLVAKLNLGNTDDATWKEREVVVLAIGAIAEGCINRLYPHMSEIVAFLIPFLDDKFPLIRSISCWTLLRFSKYIVNNDLGLDCLDTVEIVMALEEEFRFEIPDNEADNLNNLNHVPRMIFSGKWNTYGITENCPTYKESVKGSVAGAGDAPLLFIVHHPFNL